MRALKSTVAGLSFLAAASGPAFPADIQSTYTEINLDECIIMETHELGVSFACPGYKGYPLYVAEGDLRFFVSYGFGAPDEKAARQTIPEFNYINSTLEWRLSNETGDWRPFATILRWIIDDPDRENDPTILVVTKVAPGDTCHVAYIDTSLVPNANEIARQWADTTVPEFDCATDEPYFVPS